MYLKRIIFVFVCSLSVLCRADDTFESAIPKYDVGAFMERFGALEKKVSEQSALITKQAEQLEKQMTDIKHLDAVVQTQGGIISHLESELQQHSQPHLVNDMIQQQASAPRRTSRFVMDNYETVAFHATRVGTLDHIRVNQTLVFNSVKLNIGGAYHASGGIFIAPISGIYIFSTSVTFNNNGDESHMIIEKNGVEIAGAYGNARNGPHEQGSVSVVLELKVGDEVYVSNQRHTDVIAYGDNLSSFMGCLIVQV